MKNIIKLKILTQQKVVFSDDVAEIVVTTESGEITILPNHSPLVSLVRVGEIKIRHTNDKDLTPMTISSGIIEIRPSDLKKNIPTEVIILASRSEKLSDLVLLRAEEAYEKAKKTMEEKMSSESGLDEENFEKYQDLIDKELNRIKVYKKYQ
jgi:F-type H+-transporting ATPase subunit epsilon